MAGAESAAFPPKAFLNRVRRWVSNQQDGVLLEEVTGCGEWGGDGLMVLLPVATG